MVRDYGRLRPLTFRTLNSRYLSAEGRSPVQRPPLTGIGVATCVGARAGIFVRMIAITAP